MNTYKILGQVSPAATTSEVLYTVPSVTSSVCSSIVVCNRASTFTTFRISISQGGAPITDKDYLYYDVTIAGNDTFVATIGISLATTDVVKVYAGSAFVSFNLFGTEITA